MGNGHEVLIVAPTHTGFLLPQGVLPDNDRSYPVCYQEVNDALTGGVQVVVNAPVACVGNALHLAGDTLPILFGKLLLELFHAFVVPLVPRFERTTVNQARDKALSV